MASTYSFFNSWKACQTLHLLGAVREQQFMARSALYRLGRPFQLRTQSNKKNTPWHCRFEWKRDLRERLLQIPQRPINQDFVLVSFEQDHTIKKNDLTSVVQKMLNSNVAISASNADVVLLDSVPHWRQFGYFLRFSLWKITSSASTMYGHASRNWLYPSRFFYLTSDVHVEDNLLLSFITRI